MIWSLIMNEFGGWIIAGIGGVAAFLFAYFKGRGDGRNSKKLKSAEKQLKDAQTVQEKRTEAELMDDNEVNKEFDKWTPKS